MLAFSQDKSRVNAGLAYGKTSSTLLSNSFAIQTVARAGVCHYSCISVSFKAQWFSIKAIILIITLIKLKKIKNK
jgi:hypothetical protein